MDTKPLTAIGLMSGTSMDGVDAALLRTDGVSLVEPGPALTMPYSDAFRARLRAILGPAARAQSGAEQVEADLTRLHADAVNLLLAEAGLSPADVDVIGFHGHTVHHDPARGVTVQIGQGDVLAARVGIDVVNDLRAADVAAGGQGAPLVPVFHQALVRGAAGLETPVAVLNIGGVANVTWVGADDDELLAFDTGPGNAPLNDWVFGHTGADCDRDGRLAAAGRVRDGVLAQLLDHPYFTRTPPKSLDRQDFSFDAVTGMSLEDGAATLTAFVAASVARSVAHFPQIPECWVVTGGGRRNPVMMEALERELGVDVRAAESLGWDGDAMEAQAFAYLAVRSLKGLPITFPGTTGVGEPARGGVHHRALRD
ncbi:MAG: anhydro-N-acetylmuramic acid kinase [Alphaproteobacteria bacterium]|nr:anhydro-N-acetylmuramic acid kinase [Alphaproteobacteria bacterium]MBF0250954.1 anhydro-N-acetylmuramic acid kinase [Alphaproteobacteria bacterium]